MNPWGLYYSLWLGFLGACSVSTATDTSTESSPVVIVKAQSESDEITEDDVSEGGNELLKVNKFVAGYPVGLRLALFPDKEDQLGDAASQLQQERDLIIGSASSCKPKELEAEVLNPPETCFQIGSELIYQTNDAGVATGTLNGLNADGVPCALVAAKHLTGDIVNLAQQSLALLRATICEIKKSEILSTPLPGERFDILPEANSNLPVAGGEAVKASFARLDNHGARPRYRVDISYVLPEGQNFDIHLVHVPRGEQENDTYTGVLWFSMVAHSKEASSAPVDVYASVSYARFLLGERDVAGTLLPGESPPETKDYKIQGRIRRAKIIPEHAKGVFDSHGQLDFNHSIDANGQLVDPETLDYYPVQNLVMNDLLQYDFEQDFAAGTAVVEIWSNPDPYFDDAAQGLVLKVGRTQEELIEGCALMGASSSSMAAALSIRRAFQEDLPLKIMGYHHPTTQSSDLGACVMTTTELTSDSTGSFLRKTCESKELTWYLPYLMPSWLDYIEQDWGTQMVRQCFIDDGTGTITIDPNQIFSPAGYDLVTPTDADRDALGPPFLGMIESVDLN